MKILETWMCMQMMLVCRVECLFKQWQKNTNLNNPYNWDSGRIPCGNDRMVLPDDGPVVFLQMNTTIRELVMPRSGELVLGNFATLAFTNEPDHSAACLDSGTDSTFNATSNEDWIDPDNWCPTDTEQGGCKDIALLDTERVPCNSTFNATSPEDWIDPDNWCTTDTEQGGCKDVALLDTERVPCSTDNVVFPTGSSYYVNLGTNLNIEVNTLKVSGKAYSQTSFRDYLSTDNGRNVFPPPTSGSQSYVTIHRRRCTDMTGCACGNDRTMFQEAVCKIQQKRCKRPLCSKSFRPVGHCCNICGGMMNVTIGVGFNFDTLKNTLQRNFLDDKESYKDVQYIVSKRSDGVVQVVLTDQNGQSSSKVAKDMFTEIQTDIKRGGISYSVKDVTILTSGAGSGASTSKHTGRASAPRGKVAGIVIGVIVGLCIIAAFGLFLYKRKNTSEEGGGFKVFNKFNIRPDRRPNPSFPQSVAFSWGPWGSRDSGLSSVGGPPSQGFDNPIYGSSGQEGIYPMELQLTPSECSGISEDQPIDDQGFENPLYDNVQQESHFENPCFGSTENVATIGGPGQDRNEETNA